MPFTPISNIVPQLAKDASGTSASGYYLKFYAGGTSTPINMASASDGSGLLAKCQLDSLGYPLNGSGDVFIPYVDQNYKAVLYTNETDADNNAIGSAAWAVDDILQIASANSVSQAVKYFDLLSDAIASASLVDGDVLIVKERSSGNGGGAVWNVVLSSTVTENAYTIVQCTGVATLSLVLQKSNNTIDIIAAGADPTGGTVINDVWKYSMELFSNGEGGRLLIPNGTFLVEPTWRSAGDLDKQLDFPYDNVTVELQGDLQVDTHGNRYCCLLFGRRRGSTSTTENRVRNIRLTGSGRIIGDRSTHTVSDTNYGIGLYISNCKDSQIDGSITVQDVYGDGHYVAALPYGPADGDDNTDSECIDVTVYGGVSRNNYRNNVSILDNKGITYIAHVADGANGGSPQAGFDVEPDSASFVCEDIKLIGCKAINNEGSGIELPDTSAGDIRSCLIQGCTVENNGSSSNGFGGIRVISHDGDGSIRIIGNEVLNNYGLGIDVDGADAGGTNAERRIIISDNFVSGTLEGTKESIQMGYGISCRRGVIGAIISNNIIEKCAHHGIYVESLTAVTNRDIIISDNMSYANSQQTDNTYDNIHVGANCSTIKVNGGMVRRETSAVTVTNEPRYGVYVGSNNCIVSGVDVKTGGQTKNLEYPLAAIIPDDTSRSGAVYRCAGYVNETTFRTSAFSVASTGAADIVIAHGLDTRGLDNATIDDWIRSHCSLQVVDEGTLTGDPVVTARIKDIGVTNLTIRYNVTIAGSGGDQCRIAIKVAPPA